MSTDSPIVPAPAHRDRGARRLAWVLFAALLLSTAGSGYYAYTQARAKFRAVEARLTTAEDQIKALNNRVDVLSSNLDALDTKVDGNRDDIARCVNKYMDTIARANGGYYRYYYCN